MHNSAGTPRSCTWKVDFYLRLYVFTINALSDLLVLFRVRYASIFLHPNTLYWSVHHFGHSFTVWIGFFFLLMANAVSADDRQCGCHCLSVVVDAILVLLALLQRTIFCFYFCIGIILIACNCCNVSFFPWHFSKWREQLDTIMLFHLISIAKWCIPRKMQTELLHKLLFIVVGWNEKFASIRKTPKSRLCIDVFPLICCRPVLTLTSRCIK